MLANEILIYQTWIIMGDFVKWQLVVKCLKWSQRTNFDNDCDNHNLGVCPNQDFSLNFYSKRKVA